jgi:hypothetical protein
MTAPTRLERELMDWLSETAMPRTPDYADDILATTSRTHQRPRWIFVRRWIPILNVGVASPIAGRTALRGMALLIVLGLLIAAVAAFVGSRRSVPRPFGAAGNGLIAYDQAGSIYVFDADTLASTRIVGGTAANHHPRWSLDGTRLAFIREGRLGQAVVVADATGLVVSVSPAVGNIDSDSIMWSPDGRQIAIAGDAGGGRAIYLVDAVDGALRQPDLPYDTLEMYWRPPDGGDSDLRSGCPDRRGDRARRDVRPRLQRRNARRRSRRLRACLHRRDHGRNV